MEMIQLTSDIEVAHIGPSLEKGRLPAVIYFALSAQESLDLDPYNQPAVYLSKYPLRVFSLNLPYHGPDLNAIDAIGMWAQAFSHHQDPLTPFIDQVIFALETLISQGYILREKIGFMGLSRGGLIACLTATKFLDVSAIVGFAPMTELTFAREFKTLQGQKEVEAFNLEKHIKILSEKKIRFYIGNRDLLVGTDKCFHLIRLLAEEAFQGGMRSSPFEMMIRPSIGHMGHGTPKEVFESGAHWLGKTLGVIK